jgi:hypothetical protein
VKASYLAAAVAAAVLVVFGVANALGGTGNGAPSGPHYTLNIHGVAKGQGFQNSGTSNNIFVPLYGSCQINLQEGNSFQVLDPDCVNNPPAAFQLPNPCADNTCTQFAYSVWARALTPGAAKMYTCYTDTMTGDTFCDTGLMVVSLNKVTPPKFANVSQQLLSVCDATTGKTVPLFSNKLDNYFWQYDNQGLRHAQLRFYPIPTDSGIGTGCTALPGG